jgi:hypothetical protein
VLGLGLGQCTMMVVVVGVGVVHQKNLKLLIFCLRFSYYYLGDLKQF